MLPICGLVFYLDTSALDNQMNVMTFLLFLEQLVKARGYLLIDLVLHDFAQRVKIIAKSIREFAQSFRKLIEKQLRLTIFHW